MWVTDVDLLHDDVYRTDPVCGRPHANHLCTFQIFADVR